MVMVMVSAKEEAPAGQRLLMTPYPHPPGFRQQSGVDEGGCWWLFPFCHGNRSALPSVELQQNHLRDLSGREGRG